MSAISRLIYAEKQEDFQQLSGIDASIPSFATYVFLYNHVLCEETLTESLKKALYLNPYFSGRLKNIDTSAPFITACDSGALFVSETYDEDILCFYSSDSPYLERSYIRSEINTPTDEYTPVLQIKLSKYRNGSILGVSSHHSVCDGASFFDFLNNWGKLARGEEPTPAVFDRQLFKQLALGEGLSPDENFPIMKVDSEWRWPENKSATKSFRLTVSFTKQLMKNAKANGLKESVGIETSLWVAYLWKLLVSLQASGDITTPLVQTYNTRALLNMDKGYFGNAVAFSKLQLEKEELTKLPIETIAKYILHDYYNLIKNPDRCRRNIAFWEARMHDKTVKQYKHEAVQLHRQGIAIAINNLTTQPIYDIDFGSGAPVWSEFPDRGVLFRYVKALPSPEKNGDIILLVTLPDAEMAEFSKHLSPIPGS